MPRPEPELRGVKGIICARRAVRFLRSWARIRSSNATNFSSCKNPQIKNSPVKTSKTVIIANDNDILNFLLIRCKTATEHLFVFCIIQQNSRFVNPFLNFFRFLRPILVNSPTQPKRLNCSPFLALPQKGAPKGLSKKYALQAKIMPPVFSLSF